MTSFRPGSASRSARIASGAAFAAWAACFAPATGLVPATGLGPAIPAHAAPILMGSVPPVLVEEMRQPDARDPGGDDTDRVETGNRPLLGAMDWGGRRFLHYGHRTYWTADGGRSWRSQGWMETGAKPRPWLPQARFRTTGTELYLVSGEGAAAIAAFDASKEEWVRLDFGRAGKSAVTAAGCDAGALYLYDVAQELSRSRDGGASWQGVAKAPPPDGGSFYEDIQAEGSRLLLRFNRPYGIAAAAGSVDGGGTWRRFPAGAAAHLFEGCFHFVSGGAVRSECGPEGGDRIAAAPFRRLDRLFRQESGALFASADSGLFHFRPAGMGPPEGGAVAQGSWEPVAGFGREQGWLVSGGSVARQTAATVAWLPAAAAPSPSAAIRPRKAAGKGLRHAVPPWVPPWLGKGRRPDGRSLATPR